VVTRIGPSWLRPAPSPGSPLSEVTEKVALAPLNVTAVIR